MDITFDSVTYHISKKYQKLFTKILFISEKPIYCRHKIGLQKIHNILNMYSSSKTTEDNKTISKTQKELDILKGLEDYHIMDYLDMNELLIFSGFSDSSRFDLFYRNKGLPENHTISKLRMVTDLALDWEINVAKEHGYKFMYPDIKPEPQSTSPNDLYLVCYYRIIYYDYINTFTQLENIVPRSKLNTFLEQYDLEYYNPEIPSADFAWKYHINYIEEDLHQIVPMIYLQNYSNLFSYHGLKHILPLKVIERFIENTRQLVYRVPIHKQKQKIPVDKYCKTTKFNENDFIVCFRVKEGYNPHDYFEIVKTNNIWQNYHPDQPLRKKFEDQYLNLIFKFPIIKLKELRYYLDEDKTITKFKEDSKE